MIIPAELQGQEDVILSKISRGERVEHLETERVGKNGKRLFISLTSSPIKNAEGKIIGATKIARDITENKLQQSELALSESRYRILAEERGKLLELESNARHQVEEANRIKDHFLATLSHELRTPLNAILGWSQLSARQINNPDKVKEGLKIIERNARSQSQIIEDLLDMNRIMSGTLKLDSSNVNLLQVIDEAIETVLPSARTKDINLKKLYDRQDAFVIGDANRLKQIIWNLLTNAVKFTPKKGKINVDINKVFDNVKVVVTDSGQGIAAEFLPFVFDRFSQADTSTSRRFGGLGLGLSIVRYLVELHGGQIKAESPGSGMGSTFTVTLPITVSQSIQDKVSTICPPADEQFSINSLQGLQALVVDDEPDARKLIKSLLEEQGADVSTAGSSQEALDLFAKETFDLIISDIGMPSEDGYQFIRKIRQFPDGKGKKIPAIALTAYARSEDRIKALKAGFQMHVPKPVEPSELLMVIDSIKSNKFVIRKNGFAK